MQTSLFGCDLSQLEEYFLSINEKSFRANQLIKWMHQRGELDFQQMTNFPLQLRDFFKEQHSFVLPTIEKQSISTDGVVKWLFKLSDGNIIETVFIPEENRGTLCISSQVGCYLDCRFCATALQGFNRNLESSEIIAQLWLAKLQLKKLQKSTNNLPPTPPLPCSFKITNVVFMGMGEPLLNVNQVIPACNLMMNDNAYGLSKYRVTISTAGIAPQIVSLAEKTTASLALSLHSAITETRDILVPLNKRYSIKTLMQACWQYVKSYRKRHILFEYIMLDGVNDDNQHLKALIKLLGDFPAKINLIPFNPYPGLEYRCTPYEKIEQFRKKLRDAGINSTIRKTRGEDIQAACGQLAGSVSNRKKQNTVQKIAFKNNTQPTLQSVSPISIL